MGDAVYGSHFKTKTGHLGLQAQAALSALGRQALHAYLLALEASPDRRTFCTGKRLCRRICFFCRVPWKRRYDAGLLEKLSYANRFIAGTTVT